MSKTYQINKRDQIIKAALYEFSANGFSGCSMQTIAQKAGVNSASIHYHFKTKENLYTETLKSAFPIDYGPILEKITTRFELEPEQKLMAIFYVFRSFQRKFSEPELPRLISWELARQDKNLKEILQSTEIPFIKAFTQVIQEGIDKKVFYADQPQFIAWAITTLNVAYLVQQQLFEGTGVYEQLYPENMLSLDTPEYTARLILKLLYGKNEIKELPVIPNPVMEYIKTIIE